MLIELDGIRAENTDIKHTTEQKHNRSTTEQGPTQHRWYKMVTTKVILTVRIHLQKSI